MKEISSIFAVKIDQIALDDLKKQFLLVLGTLSVGKGVWIVTANPEILLRARKDQEYSRVLAQADYRVADGFGLVLVSFLLGQRVERITGSSLLTFLFDLANQKSLSVHVVLTKGGLATPEKLEHTISQKYPSVRLTSEIMDPGPSLPKSCTAGRCRSEMTIKADIVFCTFGAPKQEEWIAKYRQSLPEVGVFVGVGGAIDVLCGNVKAAPTIFRRLGLEWLWRLMVQPKRYPRIFRAVIVFPLVVFWDTFFAKNHAS